MKHLSAIGLLVTTATLHAIPWLVEDAAWCGLLAIICGLIVATRTGYVASFWFACLWATLTIAAAFHWSPAAMAYTLSSEYGLGLAVATPLVLWDGLRMALGYWIASRFTRDLRTIWFPAALATMAVEFLVPSVFPWRLGFMLLSWPWMMQAVDIFGPAWTTFISFVSAGLVINTALWLRDRPRSQATAGEMPTRSALQNWSAWAGLPVFVLNLIYGVWAMNYWQANMNAAPQTRVALVQVDPSYVVSLSQLRELTASAAGDVDIVCWPESSGGNYELSLDELSDEKRVFECSREPERGLRPWPSPTCELLLGGKNYVGDPEEPETLYVCAMLIDKHEKITARYNKRYLMPFGEYVPFEDYVPGLAALFDMAEHVTPGHASEVIESQTGAHIGTMLCYEDMVPEASRQMTVGGANLLISLINGSAFESKYTLAQHRLLSQLRAVECRRYFLRCAATGETCVISPLGSITARLPSQENGVLKADVALLDGTTIYCIVPWLSPALCTIGILFQVSFAVRRRSRTALA
ncbi:MAG: apolipoprotein N-acyltransferase [Pirellulaceae bacterium]|nr:apolipoprotein N-acyltransferase [Pirellulaceae bacterium]